MAKRQLRQCPVCGGTLKVRVLQCVSCSTRIEGEFEPAGSKLDYLSAKDLEFVEQFVRLRGSIKEMEKALGVSYPTVRNRLETVIEKMGYPVYKGVSPEKRAEILEKLEKGEISASKAAGLLKKEGEEEGEESDE
jgi:hypothetical protein